MVLFSRVIVFHRRNNVIEPNGLFTCEVPDASVVLKFVYINIYVVQVPGTSYYYVTWALFGSCIAPCDACAFIFSPSSHAQVFFSITIFSYYRLELVLTCTSSGRPIDSVTCFKDGYEIRGKA